MRVVVWNVNGWDATRGYICSKYGSVGKFFEEVLRADVVCLQEVKMAHNKLDPSLHIDGWESFWAISGGDGQARTGYSGCTTFIRLDLAPSSATNELVTTSFPEREGRYIEIITGDLAIINIYVPNGGEPAKGATTTRTTMTLARMV